MRDYENSDTSSFNTYRSGQENPRREHSSRTDFGSPASSTRRGESEGTADHYQSNSVWHQPQDYRDMRPTSNYRPRQGDWSQGQNWNEHNNYNRYGSQGSQGNYRSQDFRNQDQDRWPRDNRQYLDNYGNHSQDRNWDTHRSGDRDYYENRGRDQQTWNRWNQGQRRDNMNEYRGDADRNRQQSERGYSSDYGYQNPTNQGRGYDENRYQYRRTDQDQDRDDRDEGFFDRMGNSIRSAWHRLTDEEREDRDRADRYEERYRNYRNNDSSRTNRRDNDNDGPPYSWGSSSSEDYRW